MTADQALLAAADSRIWKQRAITAEQKLERAAKHLAAFYEVSSPIEIATRELRACADLLGVDLSKKAGVPEKLTREVEYVELNRE